jgi:predicted GIY-YIG superfamily endonuclease
VTVVIPGRREAANPESILPVPNVLCLSTRKAVRGVTARYDVVKLVWYESYDDPTNAISREKEIKKWRRDWKIRLIEEDNPDWSDLYASITR